MKKIILFCFLFTLYLFGDELKIDESFFIDTTNTKTVEDIRKETIFTPIKKYNLGVVKKNVWIKLSIVNSSSSIISKRIYNKRSGIDFIDVYIFKQEKLLEKYKLGDMVEHTQRDNHFRTSYFDLTIKPKDKITIFIKQKTYGAMEMKWHIVDQKQFMNYYSKQTMVYFTILGLLVFATLASVMFYFFLKDASYIIYTFFTIFSIIYQLSVAGFMYEFYVPIYLNTFFNYTIPLVAVFFLVIFPIVFFDLNKHYRYLVGTLKVLALSLLVIGVLNSLYPFLENILYSNKYTNVVSLLITVLLFILSIKLYLDKKKGSEYYLLANTLFFVCISYFILSMVGIVPSTILDYYSLAIGSIGQDLFLAIAIAHSAYSLKQQNQNQKELVDEYSKLSFLGQTVINIYHQWKNPVNNIYNSINHIQTAKEFKDKNIDTIIDENLECIKQNTQYLKDVSINYLGYYKGIDQAKIKFNLKEELNSILKLHNQEFEKLGIDIDLQCPDTIELYLQKNILTNIIIILVENSINVFKQRDIKNPKLSIKVEKKDHYIIKVSDNAGGIKLKNIDDIFQKNHSVSDSTGLGLYLAKDFLVPKIDSKMEVQNEGNGAEFIVKLGTFK